MDLSASWALRMVRATTLSTVAFLLAVVAHRSAGGLLPSTWTLGTMLVLCTACTGAWFGREVTRAQIVVLLLAAQTTMHGAMTALAGHGEPARLAPTTGGASTVNGALSDAAGHLLSDLTPAQAPMALAHLAAAAGAALWLAWGERRLWNCLRLVARVAHSVALRLTPTTVPTITTSRIRVDRNNTAAPRPQRLLLDDTHLRRGPPVLLSAI